MKYAKAAVVLALALFCEGDRRTYPFDPTQPCALGRVHVDPQTGVIYECLGVWPR